MNHPGPRCNKFRRIPYRHAREFARDGFVRKLLTWVVALFYSGDGRPGRNGIELANNCAP